MSYTFSYRNESNSLTEDNYALRITAFLATTSNVDHSRIEEVLALLEERTLEEMSYVMARIERSEYSAISEQFVFVQRWYYPNIWGFPAQPVAPHSSVPCSDFPLFYNPNGSLDLYAWREKLDGISYVRKGNSLEGDDTVALPAEYLWIQYAERVRDTFYVLYPYTDKRGSFEVDGRLYNVESHPWKGGRPQRCKEGVILLTNRGEMRLKNTPSAEIMHEGQLWEVVARGTTLIRIRPRYGKHAMTEEQAMTCICKQSFFSMFVLSTPERPRTGDSFLENCSQFPDDRILITSGLIATSQDYRNELGIRISAKAVIQDSWGRIVLIRENTKAWDLPGGKANFLSEPPSQVLRRELQEELQWDCPPGYLAYKGVRQTEGSLAFIYHFVVKEMKLPINARWFTVDEVQQLRNSEMVYWFPELFVEAMRMNKRQSVVWVGGPSHKQFPARVLQLGRPGTECEGPVIKKNNMYYDYAGNILTKVENRFFFAHHVVPSTGPLFSEIMLNVDPGKEMETFLRLNNYLTFCTSRSLEKLYGYTLEMFSLTFVRNGPCTFYETVGLAGQLKDKPNCVVDEEEYIRTLGLPVDEAKSLIDARVISGEVKRIVISGKNYYSGRAVTFAQIKETVSEYNRTATFKVKNKMHDRN